MINLSPGSQLRKLLNEEFFQEKHDEFRQWYFKKISKKELEFFKNEYFNYMENTKDYTTFVTWFLKFKINTINKEILVLQKTWTTTKGESINSPFPPEKPIFLDSHSGIEATAYLSHLKKLRILK